MKLDSESLNYLLSEIKRKSDDIEKDEKILNYLSEISQHLLKKYEKLKRKNSKRNLINEESKIQDITNILNAAPNKGLFKNKFNTFNNSIIHVEDDIYLFFI